MFAKSVAQQAEVILQGHADEVGTVSADDTHFNRYSKMRSVPKLPMHMPLVTPTPMIPPPVKYVRKFILSPHPGRYLGVEAALAAVRPVPLPLLLGLLFLLVALALLALLVLLELAALLLPVLRILEAQVALARGERLHEDWCWQSQ